MGSYCYVNPADALDSDEIEATMNEEATPPQPRPTSYELAERNTKLAIERHSQLRLHVHGRQQSDHIFPFRECRTQWPQKFGSTELIITIKCADERTQHDAAHLHGRIL